MRIIYINHYAGSLLHGMEYRPYYLAREWVRQGHAVQIIAGGFSHLRACQPVVAGGPVGKPTAERIDGIDYLWLPTPTYSGNGVGRVLNIWSFLRGVWAQAKTLVAEGKPEVVIASSTYPMDIWVAMRISRMAGAKLVFEVHDLWPLTPIEVGGMSRYHPFIQLCGWAEHTAYKNADLVVSMLPKVHEYMASRGLDLGKLHIIPNGISVDDWHEEGAPLSGPLAEHIASVREGGRILVGYAGAHGLPNALDTLLDAAALVTNEAISFVLVGDGLEKPRLLERVHNEALVNVKMFAPIQKRQVPQLLRAFDVAYIGWRHSPLYRFGISPNKLMDYMMAGRAVLHSVSAGNDPVEEAGCGISVPAGSPSAIATGLVRLAGLSPRERQRMGEKGRQHVLAGHTYPVLAGRFLQALGS